MKFTIQAMDFHSRCNQDVKTTGSDIGEAGNLFSISSGAGVVMSVVVRTLMSLESDRRGEDSDSNNRQGPAYRTTRRPCNSFWQTPGQGDGST